MESIERALDIRISHCQTTPKECCTTIPSLIPGIGMIFNLYHLTSLSQKRSSIETLERGRLTLIKTLDTKLAFVAISNVVNTISCTTLYFVFPDFPNTLFLYTAIGTTINALSVGIWDQIDSTIIRLEFAEQFIFDRSYTLKIARMINRIFSGGSPIIGIFRYAFSSLNRSDWMAPSSTIRETYHLEPLPRGIQGRILKDHIDDTNCTIAGSLLQIISLLAFVILRSDNPLSFFPPAYDLESLPKWILTSCIIITSLMTVALVVSSVKNRQFYRSYRRDRVAPVIHIV